MTEPYAGEPEQTEEVKDSNKAREAFQAGNVDASRTEHDKRILDANEPHLTGASDYLKAIVFGGLDGINNSFAVIAGAVGGDLGEDTYKVVLVLGFANLFADAFAMGFGEFLGGSAERDLAISERKRELWEIENYKEGEVDEMVQIYEARGIPRDDAVEMVGIISKDPEVFADFMMVDELGIIFDQDSDPLEPLKHGAAMFMAFLAFGVVPILAYTGGKGEGADYIFAIACALTALTLFTLGVVKGKLSGTHMIKTGFVMLVNGCISGGVSFGIGRAVSAIVGTDVEV